MRSFDFITADVFTDRRFGGNQLAVFPRAEGLSDAEMQSLAAEMNYSETTFVLPPTNPANDARVRIFNRTAEMPFAGHPNVGTGYVLAKLGLARGDLLRFEETAGLVEVRVLRDAARAPTGAQIDAPQPFRILGELSSKAVGCCISLPVTSIVTTAHPPVRATVGVEFVFAQVAQDALSSAAPDLAAFRDVQQAASLESDLLAVLLYAIDGQRIRSRMFAPLSGTWEDAATGSANATLAALRLSLGAAETQTFDIEQGAEMGRPSRLRATAWRTSDGIRARVGGGAILMFRGTAELD